MARQFALRKYAALLMLVLRFVGVVQGVGFRPIVYRIATELGLCGGVYNDNGDAVIVIDCPRLPKPIPSRHKARFVRVYPCVVIDSSTKASLLPTRALIFLNALLCALPQLAHITHITIYPLHLALRALPSLAQIDSRTLQARFSILPSHSSKSQSSLSIPRDSATCKDCLREIFTPTSRFYHYHLCACTNCGARYSIIDALPYDRERTSMRDFPLCKACKQDFSSPSSRFYHAQPISCNTCAITLKLLDSRGNIILAKEYAGIELCAKLLKQGEIVCIKGLGGFALICDSTNKRAIYRLRECKNRPHKPFAIMCKDLEQARSIAHLYKEEEDALTSLAAPIVLVHSKAKSSKAKPTPIAIDAIAPNLSTIGILLANTPLHHLLLDLFPNPILYTSANLKAEPIITQVDDALSQLAHITPYVLDIGREILHGVDDSITRYIDSSMRPIRLARGLTPNTINSQLTTPKNPHQTIVALGAGEKITPTLATATHIIITPYIGSLQSPASLARLEENLAVFLPSMQKPSIIVSDKHPRFETTKLAQNFATQYQATHLNLYHHHAHHCAIWAEMVRSEDEQILSVVWDGSGLGEDSSIWGGEFLLGNCREIKRVGHFAPFYLLGGQRAIVDIKRIAYILALEAGACAMIARYEACLPKPLLTLAKSSPQDTRITTSSVGRIIDGVAHLLGLLDSTTYEGQAGALLESIAQEPNAPKTHYPYIITQSGIIQWQPMIAAICDDIQALESTSTTSLATNATRGIIAYKFLYTLAHIARTFILIHKAKVRIGLSGGVFQNKLLCEILGAMLRAQGIEYHFHTLVPCNDGGIAFGQAAFASRVMVQYPNLR